MRLVKVLGGFINPAHVVCAVRYEYDTKGFVTVHMTNNDSFVLRQEMVNELPVYRINERTWVNPEHVSSVSRNVDRARMARDNAAYTAESEYTNVEIVMDTTKFRQSFFAEDAGYDSEHDVFAWAETLMAVEYATDERLDWIDE